MISVTHAEKEQTLIVHTPAELCDAVEALWFREADSDTLSTLYELGDLLETGNDGPMLDNRLADLGLNLGEGREPTPPAEHVVEQAEGESLSGFSRPAFDPNPRGGFRSADQAEANPYEGLKEGPGISGGFDRPAFDPKPSGGFGSAFDTSLVDSIGCAGPTTSQELKSAVQSQAENTARVQHTQDESQQSDGYSLE